MRLPWQCPTCYAELGDKKYAKMLTCPYCGSLLIVNPSKKGFYRVPKEKGWYYFSKISPYGYIRFGEFEEYYRYLNGKWYLLKNFSLYVLSEEKDKIMEIIEEGEVNYIWGELPIVAPPESVLKTAKNDKGLVKISSREKLFFLYSGEKPENIFPELFK